MVYIIDKHNQPLMPCSNVIARLLLKENKAKVKRRTPFTIKLLYEPTTHYKQGITLGIDTGSAIIGSAAITDAGNVLYQSEIQIRNDITDKMKQRSKYRRNRRNRKTRYRPARFLNRKNSTKKDRFSPTMISKINSHMKEINFVKSILPIPRIVIETASFDIHALKNPAVLTNKWLYQHGINYGYANTKAYVLDRDKHQCQHCKGKNKDPRIEVHHIVFRCNNGSDDADNLICLCKTCHDALHNGLLTLKKTGKRKTELRHATQMNSIRLQLLRLYPDAIETFGYITKEHRQLMTLDKTHHNDAIAIANFYNIKHTGKYNVNIIDNSILYKRCVADGDYQQTKGVRSEKRIPSAKIQGFRKFDKVRYRGETYFIKGRMSSGYARLMDINNNEIDFSDTPKGMKTPKLKNMQRIGARKSWIMIQEKPT